MITAVSPYVDFCDHGVSMFEQCLKCDAIIEQVFGEVFPEDELCMGPQELTHDQMEEGE